MRIPPPYEDRLSGACLRVGETTLLLTGEGWQDTLAGEALLQGNLALRYAMPFLHDVGALVPQLVYDDHREGHTGRELFTFVETRGNAYPRADVMGVRLGGQDEQVRLRDLDLGRPLIPVAVQGDTRLALDAAALLDASGAGLQAIHPKEVPPGLPALLAQHAPCFRLGPAAAKDLPALLQNAGL